MVVRGDLLEPARLRSDAIDNFEIYGYFGISVFVESGELDVDWIVSHKLARAQWVALFRAGDVLAAGLELWDTGQSPHYDVVHSDIDDLVRRFVACHHRIVLNPARPPGGFR